MNSDYRYRLICKEIEDCILHRKKEFYIYPFGAVGAEVKNIMNNSYGITEKGIIDNKLACFNDRVLKISELREEDMSDETTILISSGDGKLMLDLVKSLPPFLEPSQVSFALNNIWEETVTDNMSFDIFYKH